MEDGSAESDRRSEPDADDGPGGPPEEAAGDPAPETGDARGFYAQELLLGQIGRASIPLALLLAAGILIGVRDGFGELEPPFLVVGSLVSAAAMFLYALPSVLVAYGRRRRPWMALVALVGLLPYLFGLAVIFAIGMIRPLVVFSLAGAIEAIFFLLVGFWFLRDYSRMTALGKRIDDAVEGADGAGEPPSEESRDA